MAEAVAPAATPAPAAAPTPEAGTPVAGAAPVKDRSAALIEKAVKQQKQLDAKRAAEELGEPAPGEGPRERDPKTGHFLPTGAKPKAAPKAKATPAEAAAPPAPVAKEAPAEPDKPGPSADSKARRLVKEGKLAEAMQTIGLDPSKLESPKWAAWRKENERVASTLVETRKQVESERAEVRQVAQQLVKDFTPFVRAREAFEKKDYDEAFQHAFGMDLNSFQRLALQSMHSPGLGKDPVIAELRKEVAALRAERAQEREQGTAAQKQAEVRQRQQEVWNGNVSALADSGDPRMAELSSNQKFMRIVWGVQAQHYDEASDSTLPALEAAELALERLEQEHSEWSKVFGGASAPSDETATLARIQATPGPGGTQARRAAKAVTSLNPTEAAEAAPATKLKGKALIEYYARKARVEELRESG